MNRGSEERVAGSIESFAAAAIRGEEIFDGEFGAEKIADGVGIFGAIDAAGHDVAAIEIGVAVVGDLVAVRFLGLGKFLEPIDEFALVIEAEVFLAGRGHFEGVDAFEDGFPGFLGFVDFFEGVEMGEIQISLGDVGIVAIEAMLFENGDNFLRKLFFRREFRFILVGRKRERRGGGEAPEDRDGDSIQHFGCKDTNS